MGETAGSTRREMRSAASPFPQRVASGTGSPATIAKMLDFAVLHEVRPVIEKFKFEQVNEALDHLRSGKARYRIVLER